MVHDLNIMSWPKVPLKGMYARIILQRWKLSMPGSRHMHTSDT